MTHLSTSTVYRHTYIHSSVHLYRNMHTYLHTTAWYVVGSCALIASVCLQFDADQSLCKKTQHYTADDQRLLLHRVSYNICCRWLQLFCTEWCKAFAYIAKPCHRQTLQYSCWHCNNYTVFMNCINQSINQKLINARSTPSLQLHLSTTGSKKTKVIV